MHKRVKYTALFAAALGAICHLPLSAQNVNEQGDGIVDKTLPDDKKIFSPAFPGNDLIKFAPAYGDRASGRHGTFGQFPAEFETPPHIHSHSYRAVVLKGEMTNPFKGEKNPPVLKPGSFWQVRAGSVHTTACISKTPCEFFMFGEEFFDFTAVEN